MVTGRCYRPALELHGGLPATLEALASRLPAREDVARPDFVAEVRSRLDEGFDAALHNKGSLVHPLRFIHDLQSVVDDQTTVISDVGSHYMWLARHLYAYNPRRLLFSNGQQTLGVALPWAMATRLVRPQEKIISISGDGGFLFSAMELETAVREKLDFVHLVRGLNLVRKHWFRRQVMSR